jgi:hypothetical protein
VETVEALFEPPSHAFLAQLVPSSFGERGDMLMNLHPTTCGYQEVLCEMFRAMNYSRSFVARALMWHGLRGKLIDHLICAQVGQSALSRTCGRLKLAM